MFDAVDLCFKSEEDREVSEGVVKKAERLSNAELCLAAQRYDRRLFDLCCMLPQTWLTNRENVWQLAGFFYRRPHVGREVMRYTFVCILAHVRGSYFDTAAALAAFNDWKNPK